VALQALREIVEQIMAVAVEVHQGQTVQLPVFSQQQPRRVAHTVVAVEVGHVVYFLVLISKVALAQLARCVFFGVTVAHTHQQTQEMYKWNCIYVSKMVNLLSILFLGIILKRLIHI
jgi:hypothetical protein